MYTIHPGVASILHARHVSFDHYLSDYLLRKDHGMAVMLPSRMVAMFGSAQAT